MNLLLMPLNPRRGVIYALLAVSEASWLAALLLGQVVHNIISLTAWFLMLLALIALAILFGWVSDVYRIPLEMARTVGLALAALAILFLLHATLYPTIAIWRVGWLVQYVRDAAHRPGYGMALLWVGITVGYIWWRCLYLGHTPPELPVARFTLQAGFVGFIIAMTFGALQPAIAPPLLFLLLFVSCGLLAMTFSHTQTIAEYHGEAAIGGARVRTLNNVAIVFAVLAIAIALASVFSLSLLQWVMGIVLLGLGYLLKPLAVLLIWLLQVLEPFFEWLVGILQSIAADSGNFEVTPTAVPAPTPIPLEKMTSVAGPVWWAVYIIWLWRILAVALVVWVFYHFTGVLRQRYRRPGSEQSSIATMRTSVSPQGIGLGAWLNQGKARLVDLAQMVRQFGLGKELRAAATIRRIYAALMVLVAQHGLERAESETPLEFLARLTARWGALSEPLRVITNAYVNVHYGQLPEGAAELGQVRRAWEAVYQTLQKEEPG